MKSADTLDQFLKQAAADVLPSTIFNQSTFYTHVWRIDDDQAPVYIKVFDPLCEIKFRKDY